jgi:5-methyltetrahydropteroyltriglutamate--homocysteine methyltransferase
MLRPRYLLKARSALEVGELTASEYKRIEDRAVDEAIRVQAECGLDVLSDGETRRLVFTGSLIDAVAGIEGPPPPPTTWHGDAAYGTEDLTRTVAQHSVSGELRRVRSVATEEYTYLRARTDRPVKATLPSPLMLGKWWNPESSPDAYPDPFDAFADATAILADEIRELVRLGCAYVQIDATEIATLADPDVRAQYDRLGIGADRMLGEGVELLNSLPSAAKGTEMTCGIHLCKGNSEGRYIAAGAYDAIAGPVFSRLSNYDVLLLEYDDERSGGFEPLAKTLDHQVIVLGLVSSKVPAVEKDADVIGRISAAEKFVGLDRLAVSCQCGFASTAAGNKITPEIQRQKLQLVGRVADRVWG